MGLKSLMAEAGASFPEPKPAPKPAPEPADTAAAPKPPAAPKPKPKDEPQSDLAGASEEELLSQLDKVRKEKEEAKARREADTPERRRREAVERIVASRMEGLEGLESPRGIGLMMLESARQSRGGIIQEPRAPEGSKLTAAQSLRRTVKDSEGNEVDKGIEVALEEAMAERDKIKADMAAGRRASFAAPPTISRREVGLPSGKDIEDYSPEELRIEADRRQKQAELRSERSQQVSPSRLETVVKRIEALRRLESEFRQRAKKEAEQASAAEG